NTARANPWWITRLMASPASWSSRSSRFMMASTLNKRSLAATSEDNAVGKVDMTRPIGAAYWNSVRSYHGAALHRIDRLAGRRSGPLLSRLAQAGSPWTTDTPAPVGTTLDSRNPHAVSRPRNSASERWRPPVQTSMSTSLAAATRHSYEGSARAG